MRVDATNSLRFAIPDLSPGSCPLQDGGEPGLLPLLGFASSVTLEPAAKLRRRLSFTAMRIYERVLARLSDDLDFGHIVAALIVVMGMIPLATVGLWE